MRNLWRAAVVISVGFILGLGLSTARAQIVAVPSWERLSIRRTPLYLAHKSR